MLRFKKTAYAVLVVGSSAAFAGTMGPLCAPGATTVPCEKQAWDFGVQALYLKPNTNNHRAYFASSTSAQTTMYADLAEDWGWGFKLEGSYHFNTGNDVNVNWYHYSHTTNFATDGLTAIFKNFNLGTKVADKAQWDAVNVEFGQHVDFGDYKNIRFHGGVQFARLDNTMSSNADTVTTGQYVSLKNRFNGFGPRVGMDMSYDFGNGLAMYGNAASAILVGSSKFNTNNLTQTTSTGSFTTVSPELEGKLGATYTYAMAEGDLSLDAGYLWVNYFNVVQCGAARHSDIGFNGPYVGLKYVGNL